MSKPLRFTRKFSVDPTLDGNMDITVTTPGQSGWSVLHDITPAEANQIISTLQQALTEYEPHTDKALNNDGTVIDDSGADGRLD